MSVEWLNVKSFGATGDGWADDTAAIQAAINERGSYHGTIYIPPGLYKTSAPITFDDGEGENSIVICGDGWASKVVGYHDGFIFDRTGTDIGAGTRVIEKLQIQNGHPTGGAVRMRGAVGATVRDCSLGANRCLNMGFNQSGLIHSCTFSNNGQNLDSYALECGDNVNVLNADITGFDTGIFFASRGGSIIGCRLECNGTAIAVGRNATNDFNQAAWFLISGNTFESNGIGIDCYGGVGNGLITGQMISGFQSNTPYERVEVPPTPMTTVKSGATFVGSITRQGILSISELSGTLERADFISGEGVPLGCWLNTDIGNNQWALSGSGKYAMRVGPGTHDMVFSNNAYGGNPTIACVAIEDQIYRTRNVHIASNANNGGLFNDVSWILPPHAHIAGDFIGCDITPKWTFASLPVDQTPQGVSNPNWSDRREGDRYRITDGPPDAKWGDVITVGGGTSHCNVEFDGKDWRVC